MKEITPEVKQRIYGLYYRQNILKINGGQGIKKCVPYWWDKDSNCLLEVLPLSAITDEDAIELAKHFSIGMLENVSVSRKKHCTKVSANSFQLLIGLNVDALNKGFVYIYEDNAQVMFANEAIFFADYLRSQGYAMPAFGYSVDELVEAGVFKLKTK